MADVDEGLTLNWKYWPEPERAFTVENVTPVTEFADQWLRWLANQIDRTDLELTADPENPAPFKGWLLKIHADNQHVIYRIGDYLPDVDRWTARFPD